MAPHPSPQGLPNHRSARDFTPAQLKLIRRSVARLCSDSEFDEFIAVAAEVGLDPLRRQITPLVLQPDGPSRRMLPWTNIDGLRVLAARQGDYRPMETAPLIENDPARIDRARNPLGIVRAEVTAWKRSGDRWHPVAGEAWWDEYAPVRAAAHQGGSRGADEARGAAEAQGEPANLEGELDPRWRRMGRVLIAKCAEAQALRRGWPDVLSGLYGEEELHAARTHDRTASEVLRAAEAESLARLRSTRTLWFVMRPGEGFSPIPLSDAGERLCGFYEGASSPCELRDFVAANRASLQTFWEWSPAKAIVAKQVYERRLLELERGPLGASAHTQLDLDSLELRAESAHDQAN